MVSVSRPLTRSLIAIFLFSVFPWAPTYPTLILFCRWQTAAVLESVLPRQLGTRGVTSVRKTIKARQRLRTYIPTTVNAFLCLLKEPVWLLKRFIYHNNLYLLFKMRRKILNYYCALRESFHAYDTQWIDIKFNRTSFSSRISTLITKKCHTTLLKISDTITLLYFSEEYIFYNMLNIVSKLLYISRI